MRRKCGPGSPMVSAADHTSWPPVLPPTLPGHERPGGVRVAQVRVLHAPPFHHDAHVDLGGVAAKLSALGGAPRLVLVLAGSRWAHASGVLRDEAHLAEHDAARAAEVLLLCALLTGRRRQRRRCRRRRWRVPLLPGGAATVTQAVGVCRRSVRAGGGRRLWERGGCAQGGAACVLGRVAALPPLFKVCGMLVCGRAGAGSLRPCAGGHRCAAATAGECAGALGGKRASGLLQSPAQPCRAVPRRQCVERACHPGLPLQHRRAGRRAARHRGAAQYGAGCEVGQPSGRHRAGQCGAGRTAERRKAIPGGKQCSAGCKARRCASCRQAGRHASCLPLHLGARLRQRRCGHWRGAVAGAPARPLGCPRLGLRGCGRIGGGAGSTLAEGARMQLQAAMHALRARMHLLCLLPRRLCVPPLAAGRVRCPVRCGRGVDSAGAVASLGVRLQPD
eukprot:363770-Chlamydomonas_euryale.AAC.13